VKLKQDKKKRLLEAAEKFYIEVLRGSDLLHECINDLINGKMSNTKLDEVIESEHKADRARENFINFLYSDRRALPFLVEDRYKLAKYLDIVSDDSEELARGLKVYPYELYDDIKKELQTLNDLYGHTIKILVEMISLMETDFKRAYQQSFEIESLKRSAREAKYGILDIVYQKSEAKSLQVYLTSKICIKIFDMIKRAEEISDFLRGLIVKYPSK
jgi:predicted phosphate transport protein (TIGR00153 family)